MDYLSRSKLLLVPLQPSLVVLREEFIIESKYIFWTSIYFLIRILNLYEEMASLTVGEESRAQFAVIAIARNGPCLREEKMCKTN